jgi:hypothetical protein
MKPDDSEAAGGSNEKVFKSKRIGAKRKLRSRMTIHSSV